MCGGDYVRFSAFVAACSKYLLILGVSVSLALDIMFIVARPSVVLGVQYFSLSDFTRSRDCVHSSVT